MHRVCFSAFEEMFLSVYTIVVVVLCSPVGLHSHQAVTLLRLTTDIPLPLASINSNEPLQRKIMPANLAKIECYS